MTVTTPDAGAGPARRHRNRRGEGERLRPRILAAAAELLDATGNEEAVTLRAVARQAGISAPAIYAHFPDRQAILLTLVQDAFAELREQLDAAGTDPDPAVRLRAVCAAYLAYSQHRPQRYRVMFGGLWNATAALASGAITQTEATAVGQDALTVLVSTLQACVAAGRSTSNDPHADAVALWLGLHGLAHQRAVLNAYPWPTDIADRLIEPLARMQDVQPSA